MASLSDNFDRADGEIGASWSEEIWSGSAGDIDIVTNRAESQRLDWFNIARYATPLDSVNQVVQATVGGRATTHNGGVIARKVTSPSTFYMGHHGHDGVDGYVLLKSVNSTDTVIDRGDSTTGAHVLRLEVDGATQEMFVDDVLVASAADGAITDGLYAGIAVWSNVGGRWDNWSAADLTATSSSPAAGVLAVAGQALVIGRAILMPDEP